MARPGKKKPKKKNSKNKAPATDNHDVSSSDESLSIVADSPLSLPPIRQNPLLAGFFMDTAALRSFCDGLITAADNASLICQSMRGLQLGLLDDELRNVVLDLLISLPMFLEKIYNSMGNCLNTAAKLASMQYSTDNGFPITVDEFSQLGKLINQTPATILLRPNTVATTKGRRRHRKKSVGGLQPKQIQQERVGPMFTAMNVGICLLAVMEERMAALAAVLEPEELRDWGREPEVMLHITREIYTQAEELLLRRGIVGENDDGLFRMESSLSDELDEVLKEFWVSDLMSMFKNMRERNKGLLDHALLKIN